MLASGGLYAEHPFGGEGRQAYYLADAEGDNSNDDTQYGGQEVFNYGRGVCSEVFSNVIYATRKD